MAASVFVGGNYYTIHKALTTNNETAVYTCGDQKELAFDVTSIWVSATTANADTVTIVHYTLVDTTKYTIVFKGIVGANVPLQIEGLPVVHMVVGDIIYATATAGATNNLHVHFTGLKTNRSPERGS